MNLSILFVCRETAGNAGFDLRTNEVVKQIRKNYSGSVDIFSFNSFFKITNERAIGFLSVFAKYPAQLIYLIKHKPSLLVIQRVNYHSLIPFIYAVLWQIPFILDMDDWEFRENIRRIFFLSNSLSENLSRLMASKAELVICASNFLLNYYRKLNSAVYLIPTGINQDKFTLPGVSGKKRDIVWSGSLDAGRSEVLDELICFVKAFINSSLSFNLKIIARGDLVEELALFLAENRDERVILYKNQSNRRVAELISSAEFGILPLFSERKFFQAKSPVKVFEYMACGIYTLAPKALETDYILNENCGRCFEKRSDLLSFLSENKVSPDIVSIRKYFLENFSSRISADKWLNSFRRIS